MTRNIFRKNDKPKFESKNEERWMHDLYNEVEQAPKNKDELLKTYGRDIRKKQNVLSERPKGRNQVVNKISLSEAVKRSMGWSSRPRRIDKIELKDDKTGSGHILRKDDNLIQDSQSAVEIKDIKDNFQFSKSSLNIDSKPFTPSSNLQNRLKDLKCPNEESDASKCESFKLENSKIPDYKLKNEDFSRNGDIKDSEFTQENAVTIESSDNSDFKTLTSSRLQNRLDRHNCLKDTKVISKCEISKKLEVTTSQNAATHQAIQEIENNSPQIISSLHVPLPSQSKLNDRLNRYKCKPTESLSPNRHDVPSSINNDSTFNIFKVPASTNAEKYHHKQYSAYNNAKEWACYEQSHYDFSIAMPSIEHQLPINSLFSSSKLQNRLDRIRETISLDDKQKNCNEIKQNESPHVEISQGVEDSSYQFFNENSYSPGSTELHDYLDQFRYTTNADVVCTSPENCEEFKPIDESNKSPENLATECLSKLSPDQQASLQYISSHIKPKYFSEIYDYYVDYYTEVQNVPLDLPAVNTYLKTQGIAYQESGTHVIKSSLIQNPQPVRHQKRERKPIRIVNPNEAIEKVGTTEYNKNLDDILENLFTFKIRI